MFKRKWQYKIEKPVIELEVNTDVIDANVEVVIIDLCSN